MKISLTVLKLQSGHEYMYVVKFAIFQCSNDNNSERMHPKLGFLCCACGLILLNISVNFHENTLNVFFSYGVDKVL